MDLIIKVIFILAVMIVFLLMYIQERKREKERNPYEEEIIDKFCFSPESIILNGEPLKKEDVYYLPSPEKTPVGLYDDVEVIKVGKKKRYSHWGLFNHALQSGKKFILAHRFSDGLGYDEILKMKKALKDTGKDIYWLEVGDNFETALKSDNIIFRGKDGNLESVETSRLISRN